MNKKTTVPGLNLSELRDLAYRVKPVVKANERLFFVKETGFWSGIADFLLWNSVTSRQQHSKLNPNKM